MKRIAALALIISVIGLFSCGKELSEENGFGNVSGSFRADINDTSWVANRLARATRVGGFITLYGGGTDQKSITLTVADSGVHSYQFLNTSFTNVASFEDSSRIPIATWSTNQWSNNGVYGDLNITKIDTLHKTMTGTFGIRVYRSLDGLIKYITNGVFTDIPYTGTNPVTPLVDTFKVKNDGTQFTYTRLDSKLIGSNINIAASQNLAPEILNIIFPANLTPGDHPFDATVIGIFNPVATNFYQSTSGTLTILENNPITQRVRGSFSFIATDPLGGPPAAHTFTEGYFAVTYQ